MAFVDTITSEIETILNTKWVERDGTVVPSTDSVALKDGAVKVDATFLYADLVGSSKLAKLCPWQTTAKIIRAYLDCCTRLIRVHGGEIRSFDGDRVMGIFKTTSKNNSAVQCAREIDWMVEQVLNPKATAKFESVRNNSIHIKHCIGIDTGSAVAVRAGIRNNNDLIWIGRPPSLAAKLSDIREYPYAVLISKDCYSALSDSNKTVNGESIWEARTMQYAEETQSIYRTRSMLEP
jgi:adenylate cyclase